MLDNDDLVRRVKLIMLKIWDVPPHVSDFEMHKYAASLIARIEAEDSRYALDLHTRDIQVNWLRLPPTKDYSEIVDWTLALVRHADAM